MSPSHARFFPKPSKLFLVLHRSGGSIKEKFETICKKYFPGSASEDSFLLFPLSSKLFHYFPCTINLLMDRIASCKNTHKINLEFRGFLNFAKSCTGQILPHSLAKKTSIGSLLMTHFDFDATRG